MMTDTFENYFYVTSMALTIRLATVRRRPPRDAADGLVSDQVLVAGPTSGTHFSVPQKRPPFSQSFSYKLSHKLVTAFRN